MLISEIGGLDQRYLGDGVFEYSWFPVDPKKLDGYIAVINKGFLDRKHDSSYRRPVGDRERFFQTFRLEVGTFKAQSLTSVKFAVFAYLNNKISGEAMLLGEPATVVRVIRNPDPFQDFVELGVAAMKAVAGAVEGDITYNKKLLPRINEQLAVAYQEICVAKVARQRFQTIALGLIHSIEEPPDGILDLKLCEGLLEDLKLVHNKLGGGVNAD